MTITGKTRKPCILVADDEAEIRQVLSEVLTREGFQVLSAENGEAALKLARKHAGEIALLVTDVKMPKLDGFDLQERLSLERPNIKLLVISGALESNIEGEDFPLLRKPFGLRELADKVHDILGQSVKGIELIPVS